MLAKYSSRQTEAARSTVSLINKRKWEINPTEDFDINFEKTTVYESWQEDWGKKKKKKV